MLFKTSPPVKPFQWLKTVRRKRAHRTQKIPNIGQLPEIGFQTLETTLWIFPPEQSERGRTEVRQRPKGEAMLGRMVLIFFLKTSVKNPGGGLFSDP